MEDVVPMERVQTSPSSTFDRSSSRAQLLLDAIRFLKDPRVQNCTLQRRIQFLCTKKLSWNEICQVFERAGQGGSLDELKRRLKTKFSPEANPITSELQAHLCKMTPEDGHTFSDSLLDLVTGTSWGKNLSRVMISTLALVGGLQLVQRYLPLEVHWQGKKFFPLRESSSQERNADVFKPDGNTKKLDEVKEEVIERIENDVQYKKTKDALAKAEEQLTKTRQECSELRDTIVKIRKELSFKQKKIDKLLLENFQLKREHHEIKSERCDEIKNVINVPGTNLEIDMNDVNIGKYGLLVDTIN